jgi:hypothetical protein
MRDEFLSEEDLDFRNLTTEERAAHWHLWFLQAQATNDNDLWTYAHGVFEEVPECARVSPARAVTGPAVRRP